ncbi:Hsp20 family protein [Microbacteriaceae bacterium 4G12]
MCAKKKKDCFLQVEGFEQWMDQFCSDPYASFHYPHGIRVDLFETEEEYILEADLPTMHQQEVCIEKTEEGLCIIVQHEGACARKRNIDLPMNVKYKKMNAYFENGLLEIHISKHEFFSSLERTVLFAE